MPQIIEFSHRVRVYIEDTDAGGIMYYVNYLKFMERARSEWLRSMGFDHGRMAELNAQFVVRACTINYRQPALMDDELIVTAAATVNRASIDFVQRILKDGQLLCEANISVACVRADNLKPQGLPRSVRAALMKE
ncbi:MAG TPA: tol-pal system-associated acyl-CoA thioesterase [Alcanivoracaceae bacterium]|nr:tol-pal system-associated acyl-CoA thioesterase [Alcanivoracaceae bacterium]